MKNMNQMTITGSAVLKFTSTDYDEYNSSFSEACTRFFKSAFMLPPAASLGMSIVFSRDELPSVAVFSDAALEAEDYEWMFKPCAEVIPGKMKEACDPAETRTYCIEGNDPANTEGSFGFSSLADELRKLDAVLSILVPSGSDRAFISLKVSQELPLRVRVMLSSAFRGAEISGEASESEKGTPCEVVSENVRKLLEVVAYMTEPAEDEARIERKKDNKSGEYEDFALDELEEQTPIEKLDLSLRSYNCLKRAGISTVERLMTLSEDDLMRVRNLNKKSLMEIKDRLREYRKSGKEKKEELPAADSRSGREMLDELIGLKEVKTQVRRIAALARMQQDMKERGMKVNPVTLNMAFCGNPGTAKTTVARIMAKILCEAGLLGRREPVEVGRADIVGRYAGQTASNVQAIFDRAKGGLLFIDEAYSLVEEWENGYGDEAINTIVQEMENRRSDTVVVFAGYPERMTEFLLRNPGLKSRVPFNVTFADYSDEEMAQIASLDAEKRGFFIEPQALEKIMAICGAEREKNGFANGRLCRNLVDDAILNYADRTYGDDADPAERDFVITADDINLKEEAKPETKSEVRRIGFAR